MKKATIFCLVWFIVVNVLISCTNKTDKNLIEVKETSKKFTWLDDSSELIGEITTFSDGSYLVENTLGLPSVKYINRTGDIIWQKGDNAREYYTLQDVNKDTKEVILCKEVSLGCNLVKVDKEGNEIFNKEAATLELFDEIFVFSNNDTLFGVNKDGNEVFRFQTINQLYKIVEVNDDHILVLEFENSIRYYRSYDVEGELIWEVIITDAYIYPSYPYELQENKDSYYIFFTFNETSNGYNLNRITKDGELITSSDVYKERNNLLYYTPNNEIYYIDSENDQKWIIKLDENLNQVWQSGQYDYVNFQVFNDELYYLTANSTLNQFSKLDKNGNVVFEKILSHVFNFTVDENGIMIYEYLSGPRQITKLDHSGNLLIQLIETQPVEQILNNSNHQVLLNVRQGSNQILKFYNNDNLAWETEPYYHAQIIGVDSEGNCVFSYQENWSLQSLHVVVLNKDGKTKIDGQIVAFEYLAERKIIYVRSIENTIYEISMDKDYRGFHSPY